MKQLISLVKDDQVQYAMVDGDDLIPFAQILLPNPDRFGLHEAAVLGTNLIEAVGLNGYKRPAPVVMDGASTPPELEPPRPPIGETADEKRRRIHREAYYRKAGYSNAEARAKALQYPNKSKVALTERNRAAKAKPEPKRMPQMRKSPEQRKEMSLRSAGSPGHVYITLEDVVAIINQYPEGITTRQIAERLWRVHGDGGDVQTWMMDSVYNRVHIAEVNTKERGDPLPFRVEKRVNGKVTSKCMLPL